jgi:TPR repeat protein
MAVDMANRMCGAAPEGDEGAHGMAVEGVICTSFGEAAETGRCGYPRDVASARRYYANACAKRYQPACNALARLGQP